MLTAGARARGSCAHKRATTPAELNLFQKIFCSFALIFFCSFSLLTHLKLHPPTILVAKPATPSLIFAATMRSAIYTYHFRRYLARPSRRTGKEARPDRSNHYPTQNRAKPMEQGLQPLWRNDSQHVTSPSTTTIAADIPARLNRPNRCQTHIDIVVTENRSHAPERGRGCGGILLDSVLRVRTGSSCRG